MKNDRGSVLIQALGGLLLVVLAALVATDVARLHLRHSALELIAQDAALAGAAAVDLDALYGGTGIPETLPLDPALADRMARASVLATNEPWVRDVVVEWVRSDGVVVSVGVSGSVPNPLAGIVGERAVRIRAEASAVAPTRW